MGRLAGSIYQKVYGHRPQPEERRAIMNKKDYGREYVKRVKEMSYDQLNPVVILKLKGKDYKLEFNNYAIRGILSSLGINLLTQNPDEQTMGDPDKQTELLFWGLNTEQPELTREDISKLVGARHSLYIGAKIGEALDLFRPDMSDVQLDPEVKEDEPEGGKLAAKEENPTY